MGNVQVYERFTGAGAEESRLVCAAACRSQTGASTCSLYIHLPNTEEEQDQGRCYFGNLVINK